MVSGRPVLDGGCSSSTTWSTLALDDVIVSVARRPARVRHGSVQHAPDATRTYVNTMHTRMTRRCAQRCLGWGVDGCAAMCTVRRGCRRRACRADVVKSRFARLGTGRHRSARGRLGLGLMRSHHLPSTTDGVEGFCPDSLERRLGGQVHLAQFFKRTGSRPKSNVKTYGMTCTDRHVYVT